MTENIAHSGKQAAKELPKARRQTQSNIRLLDMDTSIYKVISAGILIILIRHTYREVKYITYTYIIKF